MYLSTTWSTFFIDVLAVKYRIFHNETDQQMDVVLQADLNSVVFQYQPTSNNDRSLLRVYFLQEEIVMSRGYSINDEYFFFISDHEKAGATTHFN